MNYHNEYARRLKHEATFSDLSDIDLSELTSTDTYNLDSCTFSVLGMDVIVTDTILAKALQTILKHYEAYIAKLCTRPLYDLEGTIHMVVDDEMKGGMQSKRVTSMYCKQPVAWLPP